MTEPYDPFYEQDFSNTINSPEETSTEYYYEEEDWTVCSYSEGFLYVPVNGVAYAWNGLPIHSDVNNSINIPIAVSMILIGLFGLSLNLYCARVILNNSTTSSAVKCYLLIDCSCRLYEACTEFYKVYCVLTWDCVNIDGYPFSGFLVNMIITSLYLGMIYSMQLIGNGLCVNRIFAVFFDGLFYREIERIALPHGLLLWSIPCIVHLYQIGAISDPETGFVCYATWYFSPLEFSNVWMYLREDITEFLVYHFDHIMLVVLGVTMVLDVLTLRQIRKLTKLSESKRRADIRLSIMLISTHLITICFLAGNYILNYVILDLYPIHYYLILEVSPFIVHSILGTVVIYFNLPFKSRKPAAPAKTITSVSQGNPQNKQPYHGPQTRVK